jgi:hypothetical protein
VEDLLICVLARLVTPTHTHRVTLVCQNKFLNQGDQIGRIFAYWATIYLGHFDENYRKSTNCLATFFHGKIHVLILTKMDWASFLGNFFKKKSSGHPVLNENVHSTSFQ